MDVRIGIQNVAREVVIESAETAEQVSQTVRDAISGSTDLVLSDSKGRQIIVPAGVIGYVEVGAEEQRRVGFAAQA
ncbi:MULTISPECIES: DUF3107 domain-containing protein [Micrococcaceae]|uniref:Putative ATP-binding protein n=1 Tax=Arthrobacter rhombi TaxID=71253 RepID=A0A1R4GLB6_9MICC|nr:MULTISPECIES: DUF3107 domain-containing protein [Micrococcaceae]PCC24949.1 DUF3107 domain-containing protein [Glutamicibacter sp. BW78]SJM68950.1 putative ATP-binding protein [Arthrobacter rhombi]